MTTDWQQIARETAKEICDALLGSPLDCEYASKPGGYYGEKCIHCQHPQCLDEGPCAVRNTQTAESLILRALEQSEGWVKVGPETMPEPEADGTLPDVIVHPRPHAWQPLATWEPDLETWFNENGKINSVITHWRPLPSPPKSEDVKNG